MLLATFGYFLVLLAIFFSTYVLNFATFGYSWLLAWLLLAPFCNFWLISNAFGYFQGGCRPPSLRMAPSRWRRGPIQSPSLTMHLPKFCPEAENMQTWPADRAKISNHVIKESNKGGSKWLNGVSKCVYDIVMNITGVFLRENSSNGTGVNSSKVGEKSMCLSSKTQRSVPRLKLKGICINFDNGHLRELPSRIEN